MAPNGPQRIDLKDLGSLKPDGGLIEVRFTNTDGRTEVWMVPNDIWGQASEGALEILRPHVKLAYLDYGVDSRLGLQRDRIDLMLRHIQQHETSEKYMHDRYSQSGEPYACTFAETLPDGPTPK